MSSIPAKIRPQYDAVAGLIELLCRERLNEEYRLLCLEVLGVLARKRPTPLVNGKPASWACGIVRAIGWVNFLDDKTQTPHMKSGEIDKHFGVSQATGQSRSKQVRDILNTGPMDPTWSLPSRLHQNPMAWLVQVNGLLLDARSLPREVQEEAAARGLIPFLPSEDDD